MASDKSIRSVNLDFDNSTASEYDFNSVSAGSSVQRLVLKTDSDVYINFDADADDTCFLLQASDDPIAVVGQATKVSALGRVGSGTLYIIGMN